MAPSHLDWTVNSLLNDPFKAGDQPRDAPSAGRPEPERLRGGYAVAFSVAILGGNQWLVVGVNELRLSWKMQVVSSYNGRCKSLDRQDFYILSFAASEASISQCLAIYNPLGQRDLLMC